MDDIVVSVPYGESIRINFYNTEIDRALDFIGFPSPMGNP